jgi:hypothetical protein
VNDGTELFAAETEAVQTHRNRASTEGFRILGLGFAVTRWDRRWRGGHFVRGKRFGARVHGVEQLHARRDTLAREHAGGRRVRQVSVATFPQNRRGVVFPCLDGKVEIRFGELRERLKINCRRRVAVCAHGLSLLCLIALSLGPFRANG